MSVGTRHSTRRGADIPLKLECYEEELSAAQLAAFSKTENEFNEALKKIESLVKKSNGTIVDDNDSTTIISFPTNITNQLQQPVSISTGGTPIIANASIVKSKVVPTSVAGLPVTSALKPATTGSLVALQNTHVASTSGIMANSTIQAPSAYQLVMDPRLGLLVSTVPQPTSPAGATQVPLTNTTTALPGNASSVIKPTNPPQTLIGAARRPYPVTPKTTAGKVLVTYTPPNQPANFAQNVKQKPATPSQPQNKKPNAQVIDLTDDDGKACLSDSREINFNNLSGKTFPSLVVVARPHLRMRDMTQAAINEDRKFFNDKVKGVLMHTPTKFTEWLIQQGLVRSEHYCATHSTPGNAPIKLKLGMYSDLTKFPYSGGYVWISDCCPQRFVSVFSGSIFEGSAYAPSVLLKLLYHWCSQTSVQNVVQWVKVEKLYVKTFYTNLRAVCTAAISEKFEKMGGFDKKIEVGVISLGTTSADGSMRQVKVEVLGVMDAEKKIIKLRAIEPLNDADRNVKKRFVKILEPLEQWVHKDTTILTDNTVDKSTLLGMGFKNIFQVSINESTSANFRNSNYHVMEYLRRVVPRMFQNTLSLLSRQIIQQFLDELVWRERWGHIPSKAFESIIAHIAEQTKVDSGETLTNRLAKIASNPFRPWTYSQWFGVAGSRLHTQNKLSAGALESNTSAKRGKRKTTNTPGSNQVPSTSIATLKSQLAASAGNTELTSLESYYYGTIAGNKNLYTNDKKYQLNMKCCSCRSVLPTNIHMMNHIIGHAFDDNVFGSDYGKKPQCRYCLKYFASDYSLQVHLEDAHIKTTSTLMCLICEEKFVDRTTLILHMHRNHTELELPYECNICGFRTSEHRLVVDHFYEKHSDGEKVQCPYCLKTVAFASNGRKVTQNLYFFLSHMQKHTRKSLVRKCNTCTLSFVHKGILKEHQNKHHASCRTVTNIERYSNSGLDTIMMPKPLAPGPLVEKHQIQRTKESLISNNFTVNRFEPLIKIDGVRRDAMCCECEGDVFGEDHFQGYFLCLRCRFSSCCVKAMNEHTIIFHDAKSKEFNVGKITILDKPLHCVCGFKSTSGNKLAKHLALCGRKSAYPSAARAAQCTLQSQSASFPPLINLDDQEDAEVDPSDKWLQAFVSRKEKEEQPDSEKEKEKANGSGSGDPPSMLNILGLVRKHSLDESSLDKPTSDLEETTQEAVVLDDKSKPDITSSEAMDVDEESKTETTLENGDKLKVNETIQEAVTIDDDDIQLIEDEDGSKVKDNEDGNKVKDNEDGSKVKDNEDGSNVKDNEDGNKVKDNETTEDGAKLDKVESMEVDEQQPDTVDVTME